MSTLSATLVLLVQQAQSKCTMLAWHGHSLQTAAMNCYAQNSTGVLSVDL